MLGFKAGSTTFGNSLDSVLPLDHPTKLTDPILWPYPLDPENCMKTFLGSLAVLLSVAALAYGIYLLKFKVLATTAPPQEARPTPVVFSNPQTIQLRSASTVIGTIVAP
ncbi:MAG: hypothetical protein ACKN82_02235, partial [Pirellula sp.]